MIVTFSDDARRNHFKNLDDTDFIEVLSIPTEKSRMTVERITASCGETPATLTLVFYNGVHDYILANAIPLAANTVWEYPEHFHLTLLKVGQTLTAKASVADQICVSVIAIEHMGAQANGQTGGMNVGRA